MKKLKRLPLFFSCCLLLLTVSCEKNEQTIDLNNADNVKQILFFSDETALTEEAEYYDALLDLKKDFPIEINNMKVLINSENKKVYSEFDISTSPTILVLYNGEVIEKISGDVPKEEIIEPLTKALLP
ncbi:small peptidoglycan-associated lipoprotein [Bacillus aquiflavi]|uniref:Small peptidoglycan-associated lipoprotein n=1 Tax=Bacillus aquiflavi TaxID=2672567 RepID=A0A6B3W0P2_9BACI|nr:small peptidoglycan-associated lipoprotein [Bacillus aquiflavi]MBA4537909.1 small peptidoglycan-associated lipoprotein [Bacillus aquiflavi]NEY82165.1 small peptidoglycan-associated lipoprotein [Bacillus aquiflavi]